MTYDKTGVEEQFFFDNINKLRGKITDKEKKQVVLYTAENEQILNTHETEHEIERYWTTIYRKHQNEIDKVWLQTTQPTSGGAVTVVSSCCANCVEPPRPQQWGPDLPFFGHAGHADPLDGWRCCSQKRVMSRPIQV